MITTPAYAWYGLPVVALAVLAGRLEWLGVPLAGYLAFASLRLPCLLGLSYAAAALVGLAVTVARRRAGAGPRSLVSERKELPAIIGAG